MTILPTTRSVYKLKAVFLCGLIILMGASACKRVEKKGSFYMEEYVKDPFARENSFKKKEYIQHALPAFSTYMDSLPHPIWEGHQDVIDCYWKTWEIAFRNLRIPQKGSGFVSNYVTTGFNDHIFMWGHVFMQMYWIYAARIFPFQESLDNFYATQHPDGYISREISEIDGSEQFSRFDLSSTGPNIFPWAEWTYFQISGDTTRLRKVFPVLVANKHWVMKYRTWQNGTYFANGWSSGMDNQPRLPEGCSMQFDHGHMSWIDITLEQIFMDDILLKIADVISRREEIKGIESEKTLLETYVNRSMWNKNINFYVDQFRDGSISDVKSIGAYWALLAGIVPPDREEAFCRHLGDTVEFARPHRIPSISADTPGYKDFGDYWRGGVWCITDYMVLKGLLKVDRDSLAHEIAMNHIEKIVERYLETGTIWENYAPETGVLPKNSRKDFVGFSGVSPISIFLENIIGIRADVPDNQLTWDVRLSEEHGILQYPFGKKGIIHLLCKQRKSVNEEPEITISSNIPIVLKVHWAGGEKIIKVDS